jgi:hypothetical protein
MTFVFGLKETTVTVVLPDGVMKMLVNCASKKGDNEAQSCLESLGSLGHFDYTIKS